MRALFLKLLLPMGLTLAVVAGYAAKRTVIPVEVGSHAGCAQDDCSGESGAACASEAPSAASLLPEPGGLHPAAKVEASR